MSPPVRFITVVSGLPRSGTSMMMKMLEAGGLPVVTDNQRIADDDNPKGYYEFERVKQLAHDKAWLPEAQGKVVKIISELLKHLPAEHECRIVFMRRKLEETIASQRQMLKRRGQPADALSDIKLLASFQRHLFQLETWLEQQEHLQTLFVDYGEMLAHPVAQIARLNQFLEGRLDEQEMLRVVDPALYRQRS